MSIQVSTQVSREDYASPKASRTLHAAIFTHTWTVANGDLGSGDITEIGVLPAGCRPVRASIATANIGATATFDVGFMSGTPGDSVTARTVGSEFFATETKNATATLDEQGCAAIASTSDPRGIGIAFSAGETVGGTETVTLVLEYFAD